MLICKLKKLFPIERRDRMTACMNVIGDSSHQWVIQRRHLVGAQILPGEQAKHRTGADARQKFTFRIGPAVCFTSSDINRTRCYQGNEFMHVHRQLVSMVGVLLIVFRKPVRERTGEIADSFSVVTAGKRRTPSPEQLEITIAKRWSIAPAHSTVLPRRE